MSSQRSRAICVLFVCLIALAAAAQTPTTAPPLMTVIRPVANMYSAATADSDVVSQAIYASKVAVLESKEAWVKVRTPDDYTGWMQVSDLLRPTGDAVYGAGARATLVRVNNLFANIYREADVTKHQPLITVPFETQLEAAAAPNNEERWLDVRLPDGRHGFIQKGDVLQLGKPLTIPEMLALARRFLGLPYTWGGTSSFGYDCSGFVQMLMRQRGIIIPRDADIQAAWSGFVSVERARLEPGDLLYFGSAPDKISHTGMYIGNDQFINATTYQTPVVRIDTLAEPRWTRLLVAARRLKP